MGTSFIHIGDNGFWINDSILELWLRLLSLHVEDPHGQDSEDTELLKVEIRNHWLLQSRGYFSGCVSAELDGFTRLPEGKRILLDAINSLMKALSACPGSLSKDVLNILGMDGTFQKDFETWRLKEVGYAFLDLIDGKISSKSSNSDYMPGCGDEKSNNT